MDASLINQCGHRYYKQSLWAIAFVTLLFLLVLGVTPYWSGAMLHAVIVSTVFSYVCSVAYGSAWKSLAKSSPATLTKFYLVAPAIRMMAAVMVMLAYFVVIRLTSEAGGAASARERMLGFTFVFLSYYIVMLILDCVYFSNIEKRNKLH